MSVQILFKYPKSIDQKKNIDRFNKWVKSVCKLGQIHLSLFTETSKTDFTSFYKLQQTIFFNLTTIQKNEGMFSI